MKKSNKSTACLLLSVILKNKRKNIITQNTWYHIIVRRIEKTDIN
jgi:uncharacterized ferritin-like protein (DUF455 family)